MNRPLKRLLALTGSVFLGTLGAVVLGSPAQAHHNTITASAACAEDGKIKITWSVENSEDDKTETITAVNKTPSDAITGIAVGTTIGKGGTAEGKITGIQLVDDDTDWASLELKATWSNGVKNTNSHKIKLKDLDTCDYTGTVTGFAECDTTLGKWKIKWHVVNNHPGRPAKVDIISQSGPDSEKTATQTGGVWTPLPNESSIVGISDGTTINASSSKTADQLVAATVQGARLKVNLTWTQGRFTKKEHSSSATVNFTGSCVKDQAKPDASFTSDCSGVVTVTLTNASNATADAKFIVTGANGWTSEEITVAKGQSEIVSVPAANSSSVVVKESGTQIKTYSWQDSTNCHPVSVSVTHTCAGITIDLDNPANGAAHTIKLTPTTGQTVTKVLQPGDKASFKFEAPGEGVLSVQVFIDDKSDRSVTWQRPEGCEELDGNIEETCTGLTITLNNPQGGSPAAIVLTPTPGEKVSFTLKPGESKTVEFAAGPSGLSVTGTLNGESIGEPLVWEKPEDCVPPVLPKTGDNTAGYVASGTGLVALGAVVFFLARRRMVQLRRMAS